MNKVLWVLTVLFAGSLISCAVVVRPPHGRVVVASPAPVVVIPAKPRLVFVPEYRIYVAPEVEYHLFYDGTIWFHFADGHWYRSAHYGGPWVVVERGLPVGLTKVPPGQLKKRAFKIQEEDRKREGKGKKGGSGRKFEDD